MAIEGICGVFSSDLAAAWFGAGGSVAAAFIAVGVFLFDRKDRKRQEEQRQHLVRVAQAARVLSLLDLIFVQMQRVGVYASNVNHAPLPFDELRMSDAGAVMEAIGGQPGFSRSDVTVATNFASAAAELNIGMTAKAAMLDARMVVPAADVPQQSLALMFTTGNALRDRMREIVSKGG